MEAVLFVTTKDYIKLLYDAKDFDEINSINDIITYLNIIFKQHKVIFKYSKGNKNSGVESAKTNEKTLIITIYINDKFYNLFLNDFSKVENTIKNIFNHELVHRERSKKINFLKYHPIQQDITNKKKYYSEKREIMAYANQITKDLLRKFISPASVLREINKPTNGLHPVLDIYINLFQKKNTIDKPLKQLYKYMYEYLIIGKY